MSSRLGSNARRPRIEVSMLEEEAGAAMDDVLGSIATQADTALASSLWGALAI